MTEFALWALGLMTLYWAVGLFLPQHWRCRLGMHEGYVSKFGNGYTRHGCQFCDESWL